MSYLALPAVPVEGGLSQYFREAWSFPILAKDEEQALALSWRDRGDVVAAHKLVTSHLRLVCRIAMGYKYYGLPVADLVSEGNIGLMKAVKKFDPDMGFRLSTYAMWWIKASITEYILKSWSLVKLGTVASQKKLFFSLRGMKSKLGIIDNGDLTKADAEKLSELTNISAGEITRLNQRLNTRDMSLNAPMSSDEDSMQFQDTLVAEGPSPEAILAHNEDLSYRQKVLRVALSELPEREREIFVERRLSDEPMTLEELGGVFKISRERVRQLEARAFLKVQKAVHEAAAGDVFEVASA